MNVVIKDSDWELSDIPTLFGDEDVVFVGSTYIPEILVTLDVYGSKSEARRAGRDGEVAPGWTDAFKASKKVKMWIWNPKED